jgi:hypothetical protein
MARAGPEFKPVVNGNQSHKPHRAGRQPSMIEIRLLLPLAIIVS